MDSSTRWAKYHSKTASCKTVDGVTKITNIIIESGFEDYVFSTKDIKAIYVAYMKTLSNTVSHACWLVEFKDGKKLLFSAEARKLKSEEGEHVSLRKALLNHYEMLYAVYSEDAFRKYRGEYSKKDIQISNKNILTLMSGVCKNINTTNANTKKYNILFNNCAMSMLTDLRHAEEFKVSRFTKYYWLTSKIHKLIRKTVDD